MRREAKSLLKTELRAVNVTSDNEVFLDMGNAIEHQIKLLKQVKKNEEKDKMMSNINETIKTVLEDNNWGIYFKGEPFQHVPTQDSNNFYKINEVKMISFLDKVHECLLMSQLNKENQWQEKSVNLKERPTDNE